MSVVLVSGCTVGTVAGNVMVSPAGHGVEVAGSSDVTVQSNVIDEPGHATDDTFDGVILSGDANRNLVAGNRVIPSPAPNATRYGINVSAATCDDNVIDGNFLGDASTYGTASYNNAGTGTITARDADGQFTY